MPKMYFNACFYFMFGITFMSLIPRFNGLIFSFTCPLISVNKLDAEHIQKEYLK